jgi:hypothetical protein
VTWHYDSFYHKASFVLQKRLQARRVRRAQVGDSLALPSGLPRHAYPGRLAIQLEPRPEPSGVGGACNQPSLEISNQNQFQLLEGTFIYREWLTVPDYYYQTGQITLGFLYTVLLGLVFRIERWIFWQ